MNKKQRRIIIACIVTILFMLTFPPFHLPRTTFFNENLGYGFIFSPPEYEDYNKIGSININLLLAQWIGVCIVTALSYHLFKDE